MAVANWGEDHKFEPMGSFRLCHPRYFVLGLIGIEVRGWGKRSGIQGRDTLFISAVEVLWLALCRTPLSSHALPILKKPFIHLSPSQLYHRFFNFVISSPWSVSQPFNSCPWVTVGPYFRLSLFTQPYVLLKGFYSHRGFLFTSDFQAILTVTAKLFFLVLTYYADKSTNWASAFFSSTHKSGNQNGCFSNY